MTSLRSLFLVLTLSLASKCFAYIPEEGKVTATLGPFVYKTNFSGSNTGAISPWMGGVGIIALGDVNSNGSLEVDTFFMNKIFIRDESGNYISQQTQLVQVNMGYRYWWSPYLSTSLTFYSSYSIGDPITVHDDFIPGAEIDTSAKAITLYGFDFSVEGELWSNDKVAVILDTRYSKSVTAKSNEHSDHYGALLGFRYLIQEKHQPAKTNMSQM